MRHVSAGLVLLVAGVVSSQPGGVRRGREAPRFAIGDAGTAQLFWNATNGSPQVSVGMLTLAPGAAVPEHTHPDAGEWLAVTAGTVELSLEGSLSVAQQGDVIFIPVGARHSARVPPDAGVAFSAVQVYSPAGPEQRFVGPSRLDAGR